MASRLCSGGGSDKSNSSVRLIVTAENPDGLRHVVIRAASSYGQGEERVTLGYVDLFPDGQFKPNPTLGVQLRPDSFFPRLPADEKESKSKWVLNDTTSNSITTYQPESESDGRFVSARWKTGR